MFRNTKKAQAAMEFLMTYGWAIMAAAVVIGVLVWSGALNPQRLLPQGATLSSNTLSVVPNGYTVQKDKISLEIENSGGSSVVLKTANISAGSGNNYLTGKNLGLDLVSTGTDSDAYKNCTIYDQGNSMRCSSSQNKGVVLSPGESVVLIFGTPGADLSSYSNKMKYSLSVVYQAGSSHINQTATGSMTAGFSAQ